MDITSVERIIYRAEIVDVILCGFVLILLGSVMVVVSDRIEERNVISSVGQYCRM